MLCCFVMRPHITPNPKQQNGKTMVDGLDAGNSTWIAADFATVVYRLKLLGFNAVRLPFSFSDLELPTQ